ncbi:MAG: site-specific integrase [Bacteroidales bacterium]|nr:site-specific integrase [Bacteroidales bacterium]
MKLVKTKLVFNRRGKLNKDNKAALEIEVYQSGANTFRKYINTGVFVKGIEWNDDKKIINSKNSNAIQYNKILSDLCHNIESYAFELHIKNDILTLEKLETFLKGKQINVNSFISFYKNEIDPNMKRGTRKEHEYTYNLLTEFKTDILFSEININLIKEFDRFLKTTKGLKRNTIAKHHQHIKRFLKIAYLNGLFEETKNPYFHLKDLFKREKSERISLSNQEIKNIEETVINPAYPELQIVKDMFLFSCYSGLRFSDVISLEKRHLLNDNGNYTIVKKMEKVEKPVTLPISLLFNGKPLNYILQYVDNKSSYIFPRITNQHMNRQLKILALNADISMRLTFHIARHTFGTMLAELTYNPYLIMKLMGHADIETSMIYIHLSQEHINKQLRNITW